MDFVNVIGRGSFGTVWKGRCKATGHLFAVKQFNDKIKDQQNIDRELQRLLTLRHDNLVKVFGWFFEGERLHGVFELLHHSVRDEMGRHFCRGLDSAVLKKYTYQILRAVDFLHSVNIVHRDIKPENILVSKAGVIKLADLGLSKKADSKVNPLVMVGSKAFMAPELHLALCKNYKHSDVWAVGCTVLAMARGLTLFNKRTNEHVLWDIINKVGPLTERQQRRFDDMYCYPRVLEKQLELTEKYKLPDQQLVEVIEGCLQMAPRRRATCEQLLDFEYFTDGQFNERFLIELDGMLHRDKVERGQSWRPLCLTRSLPLEFSSAECIANRIVMAEPAVQIDSVPIDEIENLGGNREEEKEESAGSQAQFLTACSSMQSASYLSFANAPEVSFPEVTASRIVAVNPTVLKGPEATTKIEILEEEQDGEREERAVNEQSPAEEEVKRKRGFRVAIRRILSAVQRHFTFCCLGVSSGSSVQGHRE